MEHIGEYGMKLLDAAPEFTLMATDGKSCSLSDFKSRLLVIFFSCNHCPYARAYEGRVKRLADEFKGDVDFVAINSNDEVSYPQDSFENMVEHAKQEGFNFTYLRDETQEVARAYGGECTPHFLLFDKDRKLRYQGRLDDNWQKEADVDQEELKNAIKELLQGKEVSVPETPTIGCSIKWK